MSYDKFKLRTKRFALDAIKTLESVPHDQTFRILGSQLLAGTSGGRTTPHSPLRTPHSE